MVMTVLMLTFPPERRGSAMGLFGIVIAFAPAIGPSAAGFVIDVYNWHVLFWIVVALSAAGIICAWFALKSTPKNESKNLPLDKPSVALSTIGFGGLLYGFSTIGSNGSTSPTRQSRSLAPLWWRCSSAAS